MMDNNWVALAIAITLTACHVLNSLIREYYRAKNGNGKLIRRRKPCKKGR